MIFTISRASDQFMSDPVPNKTWTPHKKAVWNEEKKNWFVELTNLRDLTYLANENERIVLTYQNSYTNIEIDDMIGEY